MMPTSAVTGTKKATNGRRKKADDVKSDDKPDQPEVRVLEGPQPLADPCGNGTIQVTGPDGSITNVSAEYDGWEDDVKAVDPKHWSVR